MNAQQSSQGTILDAIMTLVVDPKTAADNAQRDRDTKAARKAAKNRQRRIAEELRQRRAQERANAGARDQSTTVDESDEHHQAGQPVRIDRVVRAPNPEEAARYMAQKRLAAAKATYEDLVRWMDKARPSRELIVKEFTAALFVPTDDEGIYACEGVRIGVAEAAFYAKGRVMAVLKGTNHLAKLDALAKEGFDISHQDARGNTVFARDGVEITLFGSATEQPKRDNRFGSKMNDEQRRAAERRAKGKKHEGAGDAELTLVHSAPKVLTTEELEDRARIREENRKNHEAAVALQKAANIKKAADQVAKKLAGPKKAVSTGPTKADLKKAKKAADEAAKKNKRN